MANFFVKFLILTVFILSGFFVGLKPAQAAYATTTPPTDFDWRAVEINLSAERYWFDGQYYRFSFTPTKDFYTFWYHQGDYIATHNTASSFAAGLYLSAGYYFVGGGGGSGSAAFLEHFDDLDNFKVGDYIFMRWEKDKRYDTYLVDNNLSPAGYAPEDQFLYYYIKDNPDIRLRPEYSFIRPYARYMD